MNNQSLQFNILPFDWPKEDIRMYFHRTVQPKMMRLHKSLFPYELDSIFPHIEDAGADFVAVSFDQSAEGFVPLHIDARTDNPYLVKKYFNHKIYSYFKHQCQRIVRKGFINESQVWVPAGKLNTADCYVYECFSLRVQLETVSELPELLITYDQQSRVLKRSVADILQDVPADLLNWVLVDNRLVKYTAYAVEEDADLDNAFPVLNNPLRKALGMVAPAVDYMNRYVKHYKYIRGFYNKFLDTEAFRAVIPIHNRFLTADAGLVHSVHQRSNELQFEKGIGWAPKHGMNVLKPYKRSPHTNIQMFFIAQRQHAYLVEKAKAYFFKGLGWFKGLSKYAGLNIHPNKELDIYFDDLDNPMPEIRAALDDRASYRKEGVAYIAVYISPFSRFEPHLDKRTVYYQVKQALLERKITSQVLDAEKLRNPKVKYEYSLTNIAVAMLAKLDGVPWRLHVPVKNELIVGVGAFRRKVDGLQYMGGAFSFSNEGRFNRFEYFQKHEIKQLAGYISHAVRKYVEEHDYPSRLIIHFYKKLGRKELEPIQKAIEELRFPKPVPIFIVSINKTESEDIIAFETEWEGLMPCSGTVIRVGAHKYLLFNNTRYADDCFEEADGFPFPIKLGIDCTDKKQLENRETLCELVSQVYQFSRMYWKGLKQQNLPVTVKYPELVARMLPYFPNGKIPEFGKRNLWFL